MVKVSAVLAGILAATLAGSASAASASRLTPTQSAGLDSLRTQRTVGFDVSRADLRNVRDLLVLGLRVRLGLIDVELPPTGDDFGLDSIEGGPDTVDPLGVKGSSGAREEAPPPVTSNTRR